MKRFLLFTWVSRCLLVLVLGASAVDRVDAVGKVVRKSAPGHSQVDGAGVESRFDPVEGVEILRLNRGSEGASLRHAVGADASLIRAKLKLSGLEPGFGPLLRLGSLELAAQFEGGFWSFYVREDDAAAWVRADFGLGGAEVPFWLNLDVVRYGEEGRSAVFVNGAPITGLLSLGGEGLEDEVSVLQLDFAVVDVSEWAEGPVPEFAWRHFYGERAQAAVLNEGEGSGEASSSVVIKDEALSDPERKALGHFSLFEKRAKAGELSFTEEAWFLTGTLNREYFYGESAFRVESALEDAALLVPWGGDYVPTLESRGWTEPWSYEDYGDNYIERLYGYLVPEVSGEYHFFVSGDEAAVLYLSDSGEVSGLRAVASVLEPTGRYDWGLRPGQRSVGIELKAGVAYYLELWHVETAGGDHVAVGWSLPGSAGVLPDELVPGRVLSSYGGGEPGTYPREVVMRDGSLLSPPSTDPFGEALLTPMSIAGNGTLQGDEAIEWEDFYYDADNWLYHAEEGGGLEWLWSDESYYPTLWSTTVTDWYQYVSYTANPQVFVRSSMDLWVEYLASTPGSTSYVSSGLPVFSDFESSLSGWDSEPSGWWIRDSGGTPSGNTGPSIDHTLGTGSGNYVFLETSSGYAFTSGATGTLTSEWMNTPADGVGLSFAYHMYGANMGALYVDVMTLKGIWYSSGFSVSGQEQTSSGQSYTPVNLLFENLPQGALSNNAGDNKYFRIRFRGVAAGGYAGDMAIDDVLLYEWNGDEDGDGLPNYWEIANGLDYETANGSGDPDTDGLSNLVEYYLMSDPNTATTNVTGLGGAPELIVF